MAALLAHDCPHCLTQHVAFTLVHEAPQDQQGTTARRRPSKFHCFMVCAACGGGVIVELTRRNTDAPPYRPLENNGAITRDFFAIGASWPAAPSLDAPEHTPENIAATFTEARRALTARSWIGAAACHRRALELTAKKLDPDAGRMTLEKRIDRLADANKITVDLRDWAHEIRIDGNEAMHDDAPIGEAEAKAIDAFSEIFLQYVFTLPGKLAAKRSAKAS